MENVWPAMVSVPLRAAPVFAATENPTTPLPVPVAPEITETKLALLLAAQPQPAGAVTLTVPEPPPAGKDWLFDESAKVQDMPGVTCRVNGVVSWYSPTTAVSWYAPVLPVMSMLQVPVPVLSVKIKPLGPLQAAGGTPVSGLLAIRTPTLGTG